MTHSIDHIKRRSHAIRRLAERYSLHITIDEYEELCRLAQHAPQIKGTNLVRLSFRGRDVFCSIQRGEISTFVTPGQAEWLGGAVAQSRRVDVKPLTSLGDLFDKKP